ncbi:MAG TPA: hypothetical protein VGL38_01180 [bacterium]|jgi:hypothetical protein
MKQIRILVWLCLAALLIQGCGENQESLEKKARKGKYDKILAYVQQKQNDTTKTAIVSKAVQLLLSPENQKGVGRDYLEVCLTTFQGMPEEPFCALVKSYAARNLEVRDINQLCRSYVESQTTCKCIEDFGKVLAASDPAKVDSFFQQEMTRLAQNGGLEGVAGLINTGQGYVSLRTKRLPYMAAVVDAARAIQEANSRSVIAQRNLPRLEDDVKSLHIQPLNTESLEAFMIANVGWGQYEVALPQYTYYGRLPSERHAVLFTKETSFQSKGWFNLSVRRLQDSEVRLKEDYGSFNQTWPVYEEVTSQEVSEYRQKQGILEAKQDSIRRLRNAAESEQARIASLTGQIKQLLSGKSETLSQRSVEASKSEPAISQSAESDPRRDDVATATSQCLRPGIAAQESSDAKAFLLYDKAVMVGNAIKLNSGKGTTGRAEIGGIESLKDFTISFAIKVQGIADEVMLVLHPADNSAIGWAIGFDEWGMRGDCGTHRTWSYIADLSQKGCNRIASKYGLDFNDERWHAVTVRNHHGELQVGMDGATIMSASVSQPFDKGVLSFSAWSGGEGAVHWVKDVCICPGDLNCEAE